MRVTITDDQIRILHEERERYSEEQQLAIVRAHAVIAPARRQEAWREQCAAIWAARLPDGTRSDKLRALISGGHSVRSAAAAMGLSERGAAYYLSDAPKTRRNRCGRCGELGHNRRSCRAAEPDPATPALPQE